MDSNNRVEQIESDLKLLKNEIKQVLLEIQEYVLNAQNPFTITASGFAAGQKRDTSEHIVSTQPAMSTPTVDASERPGSVEGKPSPQASTPGGKASGPGLDASGQQGLGPDIFTTGPQAVGHGGEAYVSANPGQYHVSQSSQGGIKGYRSGEEASTQPGPQSFEAGASMGPGIHFRHRPGGDQEGQPGPEHAEADDRPADVAAEGREGRLGTERAESGARSPRGASRKREGIDLVTIAGLAQWTDKVLKRIGRENLETLIELSQKTGRLPAEHREVLLSFVHLFDRKEGGHSVTAKQVVSVLAQLEGLLGSASADARLMSFLLHDSLEELPLIQP